MQLEYDKAIEPGHYNLTATQQTKTGWAASIVINPEEGVYLMGYPNRLQQWKGFDEDFKKNDFSEKRLQDDEEAIRQILENWRELLGSKKI